MPKQLSNSMFIPLLHLPRNIVLIIYLTLVCNSKVIEEEWESSKKSKRKRASKTESIAHISIHTIHLDGLRELYRHFLRLNNGGIVEVG